MQKILILFVFSVQIAFTQNSIIGKVVDTKGEALPLVNISLKNAVDSSMVTGSVADTAGNFSIKTIKMGSFQIVASMIGYNNYVSGVFFLNDSSTTQNMGTLTLTESTTLLKAVVVSASVPLFEQKVDRIVLNIENKVTTAGATVLEILERSPGVMVDKTSGSIGMLGKQGINVMINGKLNYMPANALLSYLQSMDASNISKIELITNPPASLDAQGNAGYINIILKNNPNDGLQGSFSLTAGYGRGGLGIGGLNLNYRKNKINFFGNYSFTHNRQAQWTVVNRRIGEYTTDITLDRKPVRNNQNMRFGIDFQSSKRTTIGFLTSGYFNLFDMNAIYTIQNKAGSGPDTTILSKIHEVNKWKHLQLNLNLVHKFKQGSSLSADLDFLNYKNTNPTTYDLTYTTNQVNFLNENLESDKTTPFIIRVLKADYAHQPGNKTKWNIGAKIIFSDFKNDVIVNKNGINVNDFTSESDLKEQIKAFYTELEHQVSDNVKVKGGLRYEHTTTLLTGRDNEKIVDRKYGSLFPSAFIEYKINEDQNLNFQYSRRINRPAFSDMAPFIIFLDPNSSFGGNAALQPALANIFQAGYRLKTTTFMVQYTHEDSTIVSFQNRFDPQNNRLIITPDNLQSQNIFALSIGFPAKITNWWTGNFFLIFQYQKSNTSEINGNYSLEQKNFRINSSQTIKLPNDFRMELVGFYQSPSLNGNVRFDSFRVLNWAIQKKFKNNSALTFGIDDIFNSLVNGGVTEIPGQRLYVKRKADFSQRTFKIIYSKSFGNSKVQASRNRNSGAEEKGRVN